MKNIVIIGAGDLGKEIVWLIEDINKAKPTYLILGFLDDDIGKTEKEFFGYKVLGTTDRLMELAEKTPLCAVIAIQNGETRKRIAEAHPLFGKWENIIHPTAVIADSTTMGKGNVFFPQTAVSVDSKLGNFGLYYLHASVGNDSTIGDYVSVMLNVSVSDHVVVESQSYIGADKHIPAHTRFENSKIKRLVLIGAGGFGREVASIVEAINRSIPTYELLGFLDDGEQYRSGDMINGYPWLGTKEWAKTNNDDSIYYTCTVGNSCIRATIQKELSGNGKKFETIIDRTAVVTRLANLGSGCVLYPGVIVSVNCEIGDGVVLNTRTNIGHDVRVGSYTTISPNTSISGECIIGEEVSIGGHTFIIPGRKIGNKATVAAGSIVFTNVKAGTTVIGNPAKRMKEIED